MTSPSPLPLPENKIRRANWLGRYLDVEKNFDERLKIILTDSLDHVDEAFDNLKDNFSGKVRRQQLAASKRSMREILSHVFGVERETLKETRSDAAIAAIDAELYEERGILSSLFKNPVDRKQYADSLRQTASRNVENVVARTLFSERPLAESVYKTEALANNQVGQAINRALARGDSAKDLAKSVKDLIDPNVKGGVSYAAERLGRTELNNAFHATSIASAQDVPWLHQMEWHLSKVHEKDDCACEIYALQKTFAVEQVPEKPHPNCRCYVTPKQQEYEDFENSLLTGQYDSYLDEVLGVDTTETDRRAREELIEWPEGSTPRLKAQYEKALAAGKTDMGYPDSSWSPSEKRASQKLNSKLVAQKVNKEQAAQIATEIERKALSRKRIKDAIVPKTIEEAENGTQVANYLTDKYDGLAVEGFDYADVDTRAAQQIATGIDERIKKHPRTNIRAVRIVNTLPDHVAGETKSLEDHTVSDILFNHTHVANYDRAVRDLKSRKESGFFSKDARPDDSKPFYYTTIHEWGHVLDFSGDATLSRSLHPFGEEKVGKGLIRRWYKATRDSSFIPDPDHMDALPLPDLGSGDIEEYEKWVMDGLPSTYSFHDKTRTKVEHQEMVAESYLEFMMNPNANAVANALTQEVAIAARKNKRMKTLVSLRSS